MTGRLKVVGLALLVCAVLLNGCNFFRFNKARPLVASKAGKIETTPAEKKKARWLRKIDRKFENPEAHFELAKLYQAEGMWTRADYHYKTALGFDPANRPAQAGRVRVLLDSGDTARAELLADIYINQATSSANGSLRLGLAFQKQRLDEFALTCYQQALGLAPNSAKINRQIGYYYLSKNDHVRAQDFLSRSFQLDPGQPEVAGELGRLGIPVKIPRKTRKDTKKLDKIVETSDKQAQP